MTVYYRIIGDSKILLIGETYLHKEAIKALGGKFSWPGKAWSLPLNNENLSAVKQLCDRTGGSELPTYSSQHFEAEPPVAENRVVEEVAVQQIASDNTAQFSVGELAEGIESLVNGAFSAPVWVVGEIQNFAERKTGYFLELAEPKKSSSTCGACTVKARIWSSVIADIYSRRGREKVREILADGMQIRVLTRVNFYRDRCYISLNILDLDPVYIALNSGGEEQKSGVEFDMVDPFAKEVAGFPELDLQGIMTVPPVEYSDPDNETDITQPPDLYKRIFQCSKTVGKGSLSLGMTEDMGMAIAAGATCIRIGRAIFGERR